MLFYLLDPVCFTWAAWAHLTARDVFRVDDFRRHYRYLYMYISKFFPPIQNLASSSTGCNRRWPRRRVFSIMDIQPKMVDAPRRR